MSSDQGHSPLSVIRHLRQQLAELARGPGQRLSDRHLLALGRPMLAAGWSPADLAFAIGHDPAAGRHRVNLANVREPAHWLAWRLSRWMRDPDGAWTGYTRLGRWDWSGDPGAWPVAALSPSTRRAAAHSAEIRARQQTMDPRPGASAPSAEYRKIRARLGRAGKGESDD